MTRFFETCTEDMGETQRFWCFSSAVLLCLCICVYLFWMGTALNLFYYFVLSFYLLALFDNLNLFYQSPFSSAPISTARQLDSLPCSI